MRKSSVTGGFSGCPSVVSEGTVNCTIIFLPRCTAARLPTGEGTFANGGIGEPMYPQPAVQHKTAARAGIDRRTVLGSKRLV